MKLIKKMWCAAQCSAVQCSTVQCRAVQCSAVQCSTMQYSHSYSHQTHQQVFKVLTLFHDFALKLWITYFVLMYGRYPTGGVQGVRKGQQSHKHICQKIIHGSKIIYRAAMKILVSIIMLYFSSYYLDGFPWTNQSLTSLPSPTLDWDIIWKSRGGTSHVWMGYRKSIAWR